MGKGRREYLKGKSSTVQKSLTTRSSIKADRCGRPAGKASRAHLTWYSSPWSLASGPRPPTVNCSPRVCFRPFPGAPSSDALQVIPDLMQEDAVVCKWFFCRPSPALWCSCRSSVSGRQFNKAYWKTKTNQLILSVKWVVHSLNPLWSLRAPQLATCPSPHRPPQWRLRPLSNDVEQKSSNAFSTVKT